MCIRDRLHASEKVKYEIYRAVKEALRSADTWKEFQNKLLKMGVEMEFKYKGFKQRRPQPVPDAGKAVNIVIVIIFRMPLIRRRQRWDQENALPPLPRAGKRPLLSLIHI